MLNLDTSGIVAEVACYDTFPAVDFVAAQGVQTSGSARCQLENSVDGVGRPTQDTPGEHAACASAFRSARYPQSAVLQAKGQSLTSVCSVDKQSSHMTRYDQLAFWDAILGAWRKTAAELHLRDVRLDVRSSTDAHKAVPSNFEEFSTAQSFDTFEVRATPTGHWWHVKGIRNRYPALHVWFKKRLGTREGLFLIICFALFEALRFLVAEHAYTNIGRVNPQSIGVAASGLSLAIALVSSFVLEGTQAFRKIFSWHPLWRFISVALLFASASFLDYFALRIGASTAQVVTVGYIYMPISAILSYWVFKRMYGRLEWIAMGMLTLAILTFVFLREQLKGKTLDDIERIRSQYSIPGLLLIVCSVVMSVMGSILAERIFKDRSKGLKWWSARFYVMKVHLDFGQFAIGAIMWALPCVIHKPGPTSTNAAWFGEWGPTQFLMVFILAGQGWLAGLLVKEFSTVVRALAQSVTLVLLMCLEDPIMGNRYHFEAREVPTVVLTMIIFLSAMVFQTGRLNFKEIREAARLRSGTEAFRTSKTSISNFSLDEEPARNDNGDCEQPTTHLSSRSVSDPPLTKWSSCIPRVPLRRRRWSHNAAKALFVMYALILVYTVFDAARNLLLARALSITRINSNTMGLVQYISGMIVAGAVTLYTHGWPGICEAMRVGEIMKCAPAGFLFAVQATLMNMAYSQGITPALAVIVGRVYIPVAAVGARFVLGKFYLWIEYAAICILTLSSVVFGYLKAFDMTKEVVHAAHVWPCMLVMMSAATAAFNSLLTEKLLKSEVPFHLQKMRLDTASAISALGLIPIVGYITERAQDIPWVLRPVDSACTQPICWDVEAGAGYNPSCTCDCASGVFAGWTMQAMTPILIALFIGIAYNWLVGKLVQKFSTVHRCMADSFSLLLLYFVGDPVLSHTSLDNMCLNLVAFIVPLSSALFAVSASEMQRVMDAMAGNEKEPANTTDNPQTSSGEESTATSGCDTYSL